MPTDDHGSLLCYARTTTRACIAVYELFERMAYYGVAANLVVYLTERLHQGTVQAANNVTNWSGTVFLTPLLGAFVADAYLGRYWTFVAGSAVYLMVRMDVGYR
jgi:dipeptide/tripeptide permease